jgi:DNA-binding HxlR family transcriptional regulator
MMFSSVGSQHTQVSMQTCHLASPRTVSSLQPQFRLEVYLALIAGLFVLVWARIKINAIHSVPGQPLKLFAMTGEVFVDDRIQRGSYGQFCPVAMAAEVICSRWTVLVMRELLAGTTRFNDLRRGVPLMSPTLLSKRLKELIDAGVVTATKTGQSVEYRPTEAGEDLRDLIMSLGIWGSDGSNPPCR